MKEIIVDIDNFRKSFDYFQFSDQKKLEIVIKPALKKGKGCKDFSGISTKYNSIDLVLLNDSETKGVGIKLNNGYIKIDSSKRKKFHYRNNLISVYLHNKSVHNSPKEESEAKSYKNYPLVFLKDTMFENFQDQMDKKSDDYYPKTQIKIGETRITLCDEYITHLHNLIHEKLDKVQLIMDYLSVMTKGDTKLVKKTDFILPENKEPKEERKETARSEEGDKETQVESTEKKKSHLKDIKNQFHSFNNGNHKPFLKEKSADVNRENIKKHAFISSCFKENVLDKRCDALLDYNLVSSTSVEISEIKITWIYKFSMNEYTTQERFSMTSKANLTSLNSADSGFAEQDDFIQRTKGNYGLKVSKDTLE